jgi:hypothetical protein
MWAFTVRLFSNLFTSKQLLAINQQLPCTKGATDFGEVGALDFLLV